jgi:hypothetical protein
MGDSIGNSLVNLLSKFSANSGSVCDKDVSLIISGVVQKPGKQYFTKMGTMGGVP